MRISFLAGGNLILTIIVWVLGGHAPLTNSFNTTVIENSLVHRFTRLSERPPPTPSTGHSCARAEKKVHFLRSERQALPRTRAIYDAHSCELFLPLSISLCECKRVRIQSTTSSFLLAVHIY